MKTNAKMRALIVAVEHYPESTVTSSSLPGTISNAEKFAKWLREEMRVPHDNIIFCSTGPSDYQTHKATRIDVKQAVCDLFKVGRGDTDTLFVYITGHGLSKEKPDFDEDSDVLLTSEFVSDEISGDSCVPLGELTKLLADGLGPGAHFWFVDMCRSSNKTIVPGGLGIAHQSSDVGGAKWFQLLSTESGQAAATDTEFIDTLINSLNGDCDLVEDDANPGEYTITFLNAAKATSKRLAKLGRTVATRMSGTEDRIRTIQRAGPVETIVGAARSKVPPIRLLVFHDEVIFLGETNGQLPHFMKEAFQERSSNWKRIDVLTIDDLAEAHRGDTPLADLEEERAIAEEFFKTEATAMCDQLAIYRYKYVGTYGSLWTAADGARRAHASARLAGQNIRQSPASDYVDFPHMRDPIVDEYFDLAAAAIKNAKLIFSHP